MPNAYLNPAIPDLKIHGAVLVSAHKVNQRADGRAHHPIRLLVVIRIPSAEVGPTGKVVLVASRGDDAVAAEVDDGVDLHSRHLKGFFDRMGGGERRGGGDGEHNGDVGFRTGSAPEDCLQAFARDESIGGEGAVDGSTAMGESASVEETAVGFVRLAALTVRDVGGGLRRHLRARYCEWRISADLGVGCRRQGKRCCQGEVDSRSKSHEKR